MQEGGFGRGQGHGAGLAGIEGDRNGSRSAGTGFVGQFEGQRPFDRLILMVPQGDADFEVGFLKGFSVQVGDDEDIFDADGPGRVQGDGTDDAHALVDRTGIPVDEAEVQVAGPGTLEPDFEGVPALQQGRDVIDISAEGTEGGIRRGDLLAVEEDVGTVVQSVEDQVRVGTLGGGESGFVDPGVVEDGFVYIGIVAADHQVFAEIPGLVQDTGDGRRDRSGIAFFAGGAAEGPAFVQGKGVTRLEKDARIRRTSGQDQGE